MGERPLDRRLKIMVVIPVSAMAIIQRHSAAGIGIVSPVSGWLALKSANAIARPINMEPLSPRKVFRPLKTCKLNSRKLILPR